MFQIQNVLHLLFNTAKMLVEQVAEYILLGLINEFHLNLKAHFHAI